MSSAKRVRAFRRGSVASWIAPLLLSAPAAAQPFSPPSASGALVNPPGSSTTAPKTPPNVLLVVADDLGIEMLHTYEVGSDYPSTPNLDALAASGVKFRNVWSSPVCSPSRAAIHTGRLPSSFGMLWVTTPGSSVSLPTSEWLLPEVIESLAPAPMPTAAFGKWHLSNGNFGCEVAPLEHGYDHFEGTLWGFWKVPPNGYHYLDNWLVDGVPHTETTYNSTLITDRAIDWWRAQSGSRFAYVAYNAPHAPYQLPPQSLCSVDLTSIPAGNTRGVYKAMIEAMDHELGRLIAAVRAETPNTYVIFCSDNGSPAGVQVPPYQPTKVKETTYEGGVRVPLLVSGPCVVAPGREVTALVGLTDVFASVLELIGIDFSTVLAAKPTTEFHSFSFVPYLRDPNQAPIRDRLYAESKKPLFTGGFIHQIGARDARFKVRRLVGGIPRDELYDLSLDPLETVDLLANGPTQLPPTAAAAYQDLKNFMLDPY